MSSSTLFVSPCAARDSQAYARFSVPLARGAWKDDCSLRLTNREGAEVPVQAWPLGNWPDGSLRMMHVIAPLPAGEYQIGLGATSGAQVNDPLNVVETDARIEIRSGDTEFVFSDEGLLAARRAGRDYFDARSFQLRVTGADGASFVAEPEGSARVLRSGPLYAKVERWVRLVAPTGGSWLRFRLQFEFFAGIAGVACEVMFVNDCPGADFRDFRALELVIRTAGEEAGKQAVFQKNHGFEYLSSRFVETDKALDVRVDSSKFRPYLANYEAMGDDTVYPPYLHPPADDVGHFVFLRRGERVIALEMDDFALLRPKGIRMDDAEAVVGLWPQWAPELHLPQGRRRQVRLAISLENEALPDTAGSAQASTACLLEQHRCQLLREAYVEAGFYDMEKTLPCRPDLHPKIESKIKAISMLRTPADFFDLGDTPDAHYQSGYLPLNYTRRARNFDEPPPRFFTTSGRGAACYDHMEDYEPIWINNEYDVIFSLGTEALRSTNLLYYRQLRWFARHTIEVDFVCYSDHPVKHRAQPPHCELHTSAGAYPSHFWTQGLAQYYFLTGDEDALEVVRALAEKTIWYFDHPRLGGVHNGINREMGWAVLTLVSAWEATGDARFDVYARKLIDAAISEPLPEDLPVLAFGHTSLLLGCRAYLDAHNDRDENSPIWAWFLQLINLAVRSATQPPPSTNALLPAVKLSYDVELLEKGRGNRALPRAGIMSGYMAADCLAYVYRRTGDKSYLRAGVRALQAFLDQNPGIYEFAGVRYEGKAFATSYRSWIAYLGALDEAGWLGQFDYPRLDLA